MKQKSLEFIEYTKTRSIPANHESLRDHRVVMGLHNDPRADIFRVLRTNVLMQLRENNWKSIVITSPSPEAGKTFVAVNLAIGMALEGNQSVLLVDADLKHPSVCDYFGIEATTGLADYLDSGYLKGTDCLSEMLVNPGIERLVMLPGVNTEWSTPELLSSPQMVELVQDIKTRYESRIVIFDIPPLFVADEAMVLLEYVDAAILVLEDGKHNAEEVQHSLRILENTNLLGTVLNKSRQSSATYHYGYGYGYGARPAED
jgi:capsular exopolysaccharide synthesis family protein